MILYSVKQGFIHVWLSLTPQSGYIYVSILSVSHTFNQLHTAYHWNLDHCFMLNGWKRQNSFFFVLVQTLTSNLSLVYIKTQNINHLKRTGMERSIIRLHFTVCLIIQHCFISVISWFSPQFLQIISKSLPLSLYSRSLVKDLVQEMWHKARNLPWYTCLTKVFLVSNLHRTTFGVIMQLGGTSKSLETKH